MKGKLILTFLISCLSYNIAFSAETFSYSKPIKKVFTLEKKIHYKERRYIEHYIEFIGEPINGNKGPDKELISLLSAMKKLDYKWWFSVLSRGSQKTIKSLDRTEKLIANRVSKWKKFYAEDLHIVLIKWYELSNYVLISYQLKNNVNKIVKSELVPFILVNGKWKVELNFNRKLLKAIESKKNLKEFVVR